MVAVLVTQGLQLPEVLLMALAGLLLRGARLQELRLQCRQPVRVQLALLHLRLQLVALRQEIKYRISDLICSQAASRSEYSLLSYTRLPAHGPAGGKVCLNIGA